LTFSASSTVRDSAQPDLSDEVFQSRIKKRLSTAEKKFISSYTCEDLETIMRRCLGQADSQKEQHHMKVKGIKQVSRETARFLNHFQGYLQAYSGVIQMMNGVGPGYGDAAYGALSLLLVV
jgi:hypothetical protein